MSPYIEKGSAYQRLAASVVVSAPARDHPTLGELVDVEDSKGGPLRALAPDTGNYMSEVCPCTSLARQILLLFLITRMLIHI
jgi:hypothetical protein